MFWKRSIEKKITKLKNEKKYEFHSALTEASQLIDTPVIIAVDVDYSRNSVLLNDEYCNLLVKNKLRIKMLNR